MIRPQMIICNMSSLSVVLSTQTGQVDSLKLVVESGSYVKVIQPWITFTDGYTTIVEGTFYSPSLSSSLVYKPVGQANFVRVSSYVILCCNISHCVTHTLHVLYV